MIIRFARAEDAQALLDIYAQYIHTPITFEYELPSAAEFARRISSTLADGYPYLVCQDGDEVLGYAYAHRLGERGGVLEASYTIAVEHQLVSRNQFKIRIRESMR